MFSYALPIFIGIVIIGYLTFKPYWIAHKRYLIQQKPFKKEWRRIIQKRMPYFKQMPTDLQLQLKKHIQVFLSEKEFVGCNGVNITDEIKITVAAQACLLLLNRKTNYYPKLKTILVYPRAFIKNQRITGAGGVETVKNIALSGESWEFGKVVLSWQDTKEGADIPDDGRNVVIHEFAHQLDQENGKANGAPILSKGHSLKCWSKVFSQEFDALKQNISVGKTFIFDDYGATNPAEFFAVVSEVFFEQAKLLRDEHPKLYQQLKQFYHVDPIHWH
jgi:hypothetical protein